MRRFVQCLAFLGALAMTGLTLPFGQNPALAEVRPLKIVAFGDSLTAGYNLPQSAAFPAVLEAALKAKGHVVTVANAGVSGDTTMAGLQRLLWSVPDGTDGVILELGANDMLRGMKPEHSEQALDQIITSLKGRGVAVMLAGMRAAPNLGPEYQASFDGIFPRLAKKHDLILYPFFMDGVAAQRELTLSDGSHPNAAGVKLIVERILPSVEQFVARLRQG